MKLHTRILLGLVGGVAIGALARVRGADLLWNVVIRLEPIGDAFIRLVSMVVLPLVIASLFVGIASLGDIRRLGRIGGKTLAYLGGTTLVAASIGLVVAELFRVGTGIDADTRADLLRETAGGIDPTMHAPTLVHSLLAMIPSNPFASAAQGGCCQ